MTLDKANSKMLVEVKKLHVPDLDNANDGSAAGLPATAADLDLVNGGDDFEPAARDNDEDAEVGASSN